MTKIRVSVAMATYNGEKYIQTQIASILENMQENDELIISDDGSKDQTKKIIEQFKDARIQLLDGPQKDLNQNFANAIRHCKGEYIFFSDQDDIWYSNKIEQVLKAFKKQDCLLIQHDAVVIDAKEEVMLPSFFEHRKVQTGVIKNIIRNSYHGCCIAFHASLKDKILPIPNIYLYDQWVGLVAELEGKTCFLNEKLMKYRRHDDNASSFHHLPFLQMVKNRMQIIKAIVHYRLKK